MTEEEKPPLDLCEYQIVECNGCGEKIAVYNDSAYHAVENAWCPVCLKKHKLEGNPSAS